MRRFSCMIFCVAIGLALLGGCGSTSNSTKSTGWKPTKYETVNNVEGVTMTVKEGTATSTGLTIAFENTSDKQYTYGDPFVLEKKIKGSWLQVPIVLDDNYGFNDIGYELTSLDKSEWAVDWEWLYGDLEAGEYRIVKNILEVREPGDYDTFHLVAGFIID